MRLAGSCPSTGNVATPRLIVTGSPVGRNLAPSVTPRRVSDSATAPVLSVFPISTANSSPPMRKAASVARLGTNWISRPTGCRARWLSHRPEPTPRPRGMGKGRAQEGLPLSKRKGKDHPDIPRHDRGDPTIVGIEGARKVFRHFDRHLESALGRADPDRDAVTG